MSRVKWEKLLHFLEKQNTLPAQTTDPKLPSSSKISFTIIFIFFYSAELKARVPSLLPLQ